MNRTVADSEIRQKMHDQLDAALRDASAKGDVIPKMVWFNLWLACWTDEL